MLAHQSRKGQRSKRSWIPAGNSAPDWNSDGQGYLLWQEPYRKTQGSCKEDLPLLRRLTVLQWAPQPRWYAGGRRARGLCHTALLPFGRSQEENVNLGQHAVCQALPGSNLAPFGMEAREERKWGPQNAACLAQNPEPDWPGIPFRIYGLCQLGKTEQVTAAAVPRKH